MPTAITIKQPSVTDDRYSFHLPPTGNPIEDYCPLGWAQEDGGRLKFWPALGHVISSLPKRYTYFDSPEAVAAALASAIDSQTPQEKAWDKLIDLAGRLSPENLSCDGELSAAKIRTRRAAILREWAAAEKILGHRVTEDEVWRKFYP